MLDFSFLQEVASDVDLKTIATFAAHSGAAAGLSQVLTNVARSTYSRIDGKFVPLTALLFSEGSAFLLRLATSNQFNKVGVASATVVGIMGAGGAVGITMFQRKMDEK